MKCTRGIIVLCLSSAPNELLTINSKLLVDLFTSCLTTTIPVAFLVGMQVNKKYYDGDLAWRSISNTKYEIFLVYINTHIYFYQQIRRVFEVDTSKYNWIFEITIVTLFFKTCSNQTIVKMDYGCSENIERL